MKVYINEVHHKNGDSRDCRIDNLHIVRKQIEVDPLPTFCGGTEYDRAHQWWVIGFYCIMGAIGAGWLVAWLIGRVG